MPIAAIVPGTGVLRLCETHDDHDATRPGGASLVVSRSSYLRWAAARIATSSVTGG